ncbi:uncharacterized protein [Littorina saxatilis]|uniref:Anthrax toxin lethal/endema factor N-/C-terminal domain-containing protein n=1 Tax=Littorina saxatilis TaxID=31220 RepID=A0AAN9G165_9CAEN
MWKITVILLSCLSVAWCRPAEDTVHGNFSTKPISEEDYAWLIRHAATHRVSTYPSGFKIMYVGHDGRIVENHKPSTGAWIQVVGSPLTPHSALYTAALEVGKMLRHSPSHIFSNIANHAGSGLGLFTRSEKITVFPEFYHLKDTAACHGRCDGDCKHTCTFDGRKYEALGGLTGTKSLVLMDNVMCTSHDPHHKIDNILVHEFAHSINRNGFSSSEKSELTAAFNHAKASHLWTSGSYAMANQAEYFAEASGSFFRVELQSSAGGMNDCGGHRCRTEADVRHRIQSQDPNLFSLLSHVYTSDHPTTPSGITICP